MASLKAIKTSSLFANGYGKRLSSKLKQANSMATPQSNARKSYPPPMLNKAKNVVNPLLNSSSYNCPPIDSKVISKPLLNPSNTIGADYASEPIGYAFHSVVPQMTTLPQTDLSVSSSEVKIYSPLDYDACNGMSHLPAPTASQKTHTVSHHHANTEFPFPHGTSSFPAPQTTLSSARTTSGLLCPSTLHLSSSLSSSTCSSVEIQPPFLHSVSLAVTASIPSTTVSIPSSSILSTDLTNSSTPAEMLSNFNYFSAYSSEHEFAGK
jgi:hypothetical protein